MADTAVVTLDGTCFRLRLSMLFRRNKLFVTAPMIGRIITDRERLQPVPSRFLYELPICFREKDDTF